jgi:hypothetical protein
LFNVAYQLAGKRRAILNIKTLEALENLPQQFQSSHRLLQTAVYPVEMHGETYTYNLHDTVRLGEHNSDVDAARATGKIYHLVDDLSNAGGINLLGFSIIKCGRLIETMSKNYRSIHTRLLRFQGPGCDRRDKLRERGTDNGYVVDPTLRRNLLHGE